MLQKVDKERVQMLINSVLRVLSIAPAQTALPMDILRALLEVQKRKKKKVNVAIVSIEFSMIKK